MEMPGGSVAHALVTLDRQIEILTQKKTEVVKTLEQAIQRLQDQRATLAQQLASAPMVGARMM